MRSILAGALTLAALAWAADLYRLAGLNLFIEQFLAAILGLGLALVYLTIPVRRRSEQTCVPWYDLIAAAVGLATCGYVAVTYPELADRLLDDPTDALVASAIIYLLCLEGLRRAAGNTLAITVLLFTFYALAGHLVPGAFETREVKISSLLLYLGLDTNALLGLAMTVGATIVVPFVFFGQLLLRSGGSEFFNDISLALMGRYRGGSAKIAITASSLFGTVSGVAVSNIVATGVVTIPLMRRSGYRPHLAAAIEATASTGGQIMPPVMGAVAFLMADFLEMQYRDVLWAALLPAVLYYVALFMQADLEAGKEGIARMEERCIPALGAVMRRGWLFILPFATLIYGLFGLNLLPETAALWASVVVAAIGLAFGYGGRRMGWRDVIGALVTTGMSVLDILMIVAAAGFIIGILQVTGLGFALTLFLVETGGGNLVLMLVIAAILCIILGMGLPTVGVYILLAVLIAPSLVEVGVSGIAAHMFIFYLGMMSLITPPVAVAAFFAASIANAEPMRTGFTAMRFGWTAYVVPFLFVFSPSLLLDGSIWNLPLVVATAIGGVWMISAGMAGYFVQTMGPLSRALFIVAGALLLIPQEAFAWALWTDLAGITIGGLLILQELFLSGKARRKISDTLSD